MDKTTTVPNGEMSEGTTTSSEMDKTSGTGETPGTTTTQTSTDDVAELKAALKKANADAASHRHKAKELDDLKARLETEKLSETEKLQKKINDLQAQNDTLTKQQKDRVVGYEVRLQAAQLGIRNPNVAAKLLNWNEIEYDEEGSPTNIEALLKALLKAEPYLGPEGGKAQQVSAGATNPSRSSTGGIPNEISQDFYNKIVTTPGAYEALPQEQKQRIIAWQRSKRSW